MSDEIFRLLPVLISPRVTLQIATFRKWKWIEVEVEGGADRGRGGRRAGWVREGRGSARRQPGP